MFSANLLINFIIIPLNVISRNSLDFDVFVFSFLVSRKICSPNSQMLSENERNLNSWSSF